MPKVAVFASGTGSNFIAIHQYLLAQNGAGNSPHQLACLVSDKPGSGAVAYAIAQGIPVVIMEYSKGIPKEVGEQSLVNQLKALKIDLLALAGFMRLLGPTVIDAWPERIINIHPTLLPKFPGAHGIADSFASADKTLGITIHYVDYGMDTGQIIAQKSFTRSGSETIEEIEKHLHQLEHSTYPVLVSSLLNTMQLKKNGGIL